MSKPALVSCWGRPKKTFGAFEVTAKMHGLEPHNADPSDWGGDDWRTIEWFRKSEAQARFVCEHASEYSHFAFVDAYDVVFAGGWDEILPKFEKLKSPIVFASECYCWPDVNQSGFYPPTHYRCQYINAGFWMATTEAAVPFTEELARIAAKREKCDQGIVADMFLSQRHPIALDHTCSLCFCMNLDSPAFLDLNNAGERPKTTDTGETPVMFHANGGSDLLPVIRRIAP